MALLPATWSGFCFCTAAADVAEAGPRDRPHAVAVSGGGGAVLLQAGNECVLLSVVFPSPVCYWFGPVRPQLLPLHCWLARKRLSLLLATLAAHTGLEHERDWRAVGHESGKETRGRGRISDLERAANGGGV